MEKSLTYETAYDELAGITAEIESETVSIDVLAIKVKRASELITFCQGSLRETESAVNKIIQDMEAGAKG